MEFLSDYGLGKRISSYLTLIAASPLYGKKEFMKDAESRSILTEVHNELVTFLKNSSMTLSQLIHSVSLR